MQACEKQICSCLFECLQNLRASSVRFGRVQTTLAPASLHEKSSWNNVRSESIGSAARAFSTGGAHTGTNLETQAEWKKELHWCSSPFAVVHSTTCSAHGSAHLSSVGSAQCTELTSPTLPGNVGQFHRAPPRSHDLTHQQIAAGANCASIPTPWYTPRTHITPAF